jgi:hypothetical protein
MIYIFEIESLASGIKEPLFAKSLILEAEAVDLV